MFTNGSRKSKPFVRAANWMDACRIYKNTESTREKERKTTAKQTWEKKNENKENEKQTFGYPTAKFSCNK